MSLRIPPLNTSLINTNQSKIYIQEEDGVRRQYNSARSNRSSPRRRMPFVSTVVSRSPTKQVIQQTPSTKKSFKQGSPNVTSRLKTEGNQPQLVFETSPNPKPAPKFSISSFKSSSVASSSNHPTPRIQLQPHLIPPPSVKHSEKAYLPVEAYAVSTHHGLYRLTNQDKLSIHLNRLCVFGIFDGYSGATASDFLKNQLITEMMHNPQIRDMQNLLYSSFEEAEKKLIKMQNDRRDSSGSSALVCLVTKTHLYVANCGNSRCVALSSQDELIQLNQVHTCSNPREYARITNTGGIVFQTKISVKNSPSHFTQGPLRVHPFGISLTRCLGNPAIKNPSLYPSASHLVIAKPELRYLQIKQVKWLAIISSGLAAVVSQHDIKTIVENCQNLRPWEPLDAALLTEGIHGVARKSCQQVMKLALHRGCEENASLILIFFKSTIKKLEAPNNQQTLKRQEGSLKYIGKSTSVQHQSR